MQRLLIFIGIIVCKMLPLGVFAASQPLWGNGTHFCGVNDGQWNKRHSDQYPNRHHARTFTANLNVGTARTVRLIYFLPNDRPHNPEVVQQMQDDMLYTQNFYAAQMEAHDHGKITFRIETDAEDEPTVHPVDGKHPNSYYFDNWDFVIDEIKREFDLNLNIYFILIDNGDSVIGGGSVGGLGGRKGKEGGFLLLPSLFSWDLVAHELGHAFGLGHDFRDTAYIMSYGPFSDRIAACTAEFLSVHPYFNSNTSTDEGPPPTIELISSSHHQGGAESVSVRLEVSSSAGIHQVLLHGAGGLVACRGLTGEKNTIVEFDYEGVFREEGFTSLSDVVTHPIFVNAVDTDGNSGHNSFTLTIEPVIDDSLDADVEVNIPDSNLRAAIAEEIGVQRNAPITRGQLVNVTKLIATEANINNLTGLQFATNLKRLEVWRNRISDISPLAGLTKLEQLFLENNRISDISAVKGLTKLTRLSFMHNNVSTISAVEGLTNLKSLHIRGNPISDISAMDGLTKLQWVWGGDNNISDISALAGLTNLVKLQLSNNNISDLSPLVDNTGLGRGDSVEVWGNPLSYQSIHTHIPSLKNKRVTVEFNTRNPAIPLKISGDNQQGIPGTMLEQPFVVEVRDQNSKAFAGVPVVFTVAEGGGALNVTSTTTDINGRAESTLTLGPNPGSNTVTVSAQGIQEELTFTAEGIRIPKSLEIISGDEQHGMPGEVLEKPFVVEVRDQSDKPIPGVEIKFSVSEGGGTLSVTSTVTNENGRAESTLTLGSTPGTNTVRVSVEGNPQVVASLTIETARMPMFTLSIPKGTHLIHIPLKVSQINGEDAVLETVGDLYDALGEAVNFIISFIGGQPVTYLGDESAGSMADMAIGDDTGLIVLMKNAATLELMGDALGTGGVSHVSIAVGSSLVGVPLDPDPAEGIGMISDLLGEGVEAIAIPGAPNNKFYTITAAGDPGDGPLMGGAGYFVVATAAANIRIVGTAWENEGIPMTAPAVAFSGSQTPVLYVEGGVLDEFDMLSRIPELRVTVKNLSTGASLDTVLGIELSETAYSGTFVEISRYAAKAGDVLEIVAHSPSPYVGVRSVPQIVVSAEEVLSSRIKLPDLELYEIPSETELLANYPNPFNPETWIPYRLANATKVSLEIYDTTGRLVRSIDVGFKPAAVYESRASAIYWDGRNDNGESAASGLYFYQLATPSYRQLRRMVIVK